MLKRTPLYNAHQKLGARLIEFGGWEMPVQYTSIIDEHQAVRTAAGIFDIAHMGEVLVSGAAAAEFLNGILTNDIRKLEVGGGQYTILCNEQGGAVDDLYAYRLGITEYLLIINASRIDADVPWMEQQLAKFANRAGVKFQNVSDAMAAVAVQGPRVKEFIDQCFPGASIGGTKVSKASELKKNQVAKYTWSGTDVWVARTGYTGEDGFEIVAPAGVIEAIWNRVLELGKSVGCKPAGLGARDTLRTEVCYPLYGHELDENTTPIDACVGFFVALDKGEFIGRSVLAEQKAEGAKKKLVAFKMSDKSAPPRPHYPIFNGDAKIGEVTSGTQSPSLGIGIGLGYVTPEFAKAGTNIEIEIRGRRFPAQVVKKPIFTKPT
ncbi:MAG: glycine cleavage system protein [Verrucomicrobiales bacterium]|nr:glycine cleavage system protein [Verrucomicrobiales bacterium]